MTRDDPTPSMVGAHGDTLPSATRPRRPYDPFSVAARRSFRYRFRKSLRQRCPDPDAHQAMLIKQMVDTVTLQRDALLQAKKAAAAGDANRELRLLQLYDRHRSALLALDRALVSAAPQRAATTFASTIFEAEEE